MNWPVEFFARKRAQNSSSKATVWGFSGAYRDQISAELIEYLLEAREILIAHGLNGAILLRD
jgi:hypothetical protein